MNANLNELNARTIAALQRATADAALVSHEDGSLDVIPSLSAEPIPDSTVVLRHPGRAWADELVAAAREEAEATPGRSTHHNVLRAAAAAEGRAELAAELAREAAAVRPTLTPVPTDTPTATTQQLPPGSVVLTAAQVAAWAALLEELEPLILTHRLSA